MLSASPFLALVKRELITTLRRSSLLLLLVLMLLVELFFLITFSEVGVMAGPVALVMLTVILYLAGCLFLPPLAGTSISSEIQNDTWTMLQMTLIPPWQLVLAKLINILGVYLLLLAGTLPVFGITFFFVGIDPYQFQYLFSILLTSALMNAALSLFCSTVARRTIPAITFAYVLVGLANGGYLFALFFVPGPLGMEFLILVVPLVNLMATIGGAPILPGFSWVCPVTSIVLGVLAFFLAVKRLTLLNQPSDVAQLVPQGMVFPDPLPPIPVPSTEAPPPLPTAKELPVSVAEPGRTGLKPLHPLRVHRDGRNPVYERLKFVQEKTTSTLYVYLLMALFLLCFTVSTCNSYGALELHQSGMPMAFVAGIFFAPVLLLILFSPMMIAGIIGREREADTWDLLRMTLLSPRQVVMGAVFFAIRRIALAGIVIFGGMVFLLLAAIIFYTPVLLHVLGLAVSSVVLVTALCAWVTLMSGSTARAVTRGYFITSILLAGLPLSAWAIIGAMAARNGRFAMSYYEGATAAAFSVIPSPPAAYLYFVVGEGEPLLFWFNCMVSLLAAHGFAAAAIWTLARRRWRDR